jgi:hypothetical protein
MMFLFSSFFAWILHDYGYDGLKHVGDMKHCENSDCTGKGIVLRITLAMVLFSSFLAAILIGVRDSSNPRSFLQNDFFSAKWMLLQLVLVACLFISNESAVEFGKVAAAGAGIFLFIGGIVLLLEFAHAWNDAWVEKFDSTTSDGSHWGKIILGTAFFFYSISIVVWALLFKYFGGDGCDETTAFVSVTVILSVAVTLLTLPDRIQTGALLPCSIVVLYCTWLCASAVLSIPLDNDSTCEARHSSVNETTESFMQVISFMFTIFSITYSTIRLASSSESLTASKTQSLLGENKEGAAVAPAPEAGENVIAAGDTQIPYNYTFFHVSFALGAMFLAMTLIEWDFEIHTETEDISGGSEWANVYIKMASQWATFLLYTWTLIAPIVCSSRDFS